MLIRGTTNLFYGYRPITTRLERLKIVNKLWHNMTVPTKDSALCCVWTFSSPSEIRINWRTLLNFDVVKKPFQTAIHSIDTMDTISKLALHASIVCNLDTRGLIWKKDNPDLWCTSYHTMVRCSHLRVIGPGLSNWFISNYFAIYFLRPLNIRAQMQCVHWEQGDILSVVTKAARALRLAQIIKSLPNEDEMPTVAHQGLPQP